MNIKVEDLVLSVKREASTFEVCDSAVNVKLENEDLTEDGTNETDALNPIHSGQQHNLEACVKNAHNVVDVEEMDIKKEDDVSPIRLLPSSLGGFDSTVVGKEENEVTAASGTRKTVRQVWIPSPAFCSQQQELETCVTNVQIIADVVDAPSIRNQRLAPFHSPATVKVEDEVAYNSETSETGNTAKPFTIDADLTRTVKNERVDMSRTNAPSPMEDTCSYTGSLSFVESILIKKEEDLDGDEEASNAFIESNDKPSREEEEDFECDEKLSLQRASPDRAYGVSEWGLSDGTCSNLPSAVVRDGTFDESQKSRAYYYKNGFKLAHVSVVLEDLKLKNEFARMRCPSEFSSESVLRAHLTPPPKKKSRKQNLKSLTYSNEQFFSCCYGPVKQSREPSRRYRKSFYTRKLFACEFCPATFMQKSNWISHLRVHEGVKQFACTNCPAEFIAKQCVQHHTRTYHAAKPYVCQFCSASFSHPSSIKSHLDLHTSEKQFKCTFCPAQFRLQDILRRHLNTHPKARLTCKNCFAKFTTEKMLKNHILIHQNEKPFACEFCPAEFAYKDSLFVHLITHIGQGRFGCTFCSTKFSSKKSLKDHLLTHTGEEPFLCKVCSARFSQKYQLTHHMSKHSGKIRVACSICSIKFSTNRNLQAHLLIYHGKKSFACEFCPAKFVYKETLTVHLTTHSDQENFKCTFCDEKFSTEISMQHHVLTHTGEKPFSCELCPAEFSLSSQLKNHLLMHVPEKRFACTDCPAKFFTNQNLQSHLLTHTGEKSFLCELCAARFPKKVSLLNHLISHTGEKRFACKICPVKFSQKISLTRHMIKHTSDKQSVCLKRFACVNCPANFSSKQGLNHHLLIHRGEKPFLCSYCPAKFRQKQSLQHHLRVHTNLGRYACEHCSAEYNCLWALNNHLKVHIQEKEPSLFHNKSPTLEAKEDSSETVAKPVSQKLSQTES